MGERFLIMNELEEMTRAVRSFAIEVRQLGYSSVAGGHENAFLELSDRMIRHADEVNRRRPASSNSAGVTTQSASARAQ